MSVEESLEEEQPENSSIRRRRVCFWWLPWYFLSSSLVLRIIERSVNRWTETCRDVKLVYLTSSEEAGGDGLAPSGCPEAQQSFSFWFHKISFLPGHFWSVSVHRLFSVSLHFTWPFFCFLHFLLSHPSSSSLFPIFHLLNFFFTSSSLSCPHSLFTSPNSSSSSSFPH